MLVTEKLKDVRKVFMPVEEEGGVGEDEGGGGGGREEGEEGKERKLKGYLDEQLEEEKEKAEE